MHKLRFKTPAYRLYAPILFKLKKIHAKIKFIYAKENESDVFTILWDRYLAIKFLNEARYINGTAVRSIKWQRKSSKIFILGCGASINDVSDDEWDMIKQHDSIGINYFYFHDFIPTAHFIELGGSDEAFNCIHTHLLCDPIRTEPIFMQIRHLINSGRVLSSQKNRVKLYSPTTMLTNDTGILKQYLEHYYLPSSDSAPLIHYCSTLDCALNFAVRKGYKEIAFVGVDLNHSAYFWDEPSNNKKYSSAIKAVDDDYAIGRWDRDILKPHATTDNTIQGRQNRLDIVTYLTLVKDCILDKNEITLTITNPSSLLSKHFKYKSILDFINNRD
ncbi:hypothetical protein [Aeromonas schubertii]|uniref:hypothetical protein n=1 Tax=Aeromonas schubertii TaxID=652 RepID=UPI000ACF63AD|nr:hypothetical protein [Aeromonas schubertii]